MGFRFTHLCGDAAGETFFVDVELPGSSAVPVGSVESSVTVVNLPVTSMIHTEYPEGPNELVPGLHATGARHFVVPLRGSFELTTSTGESRVLHAGDWALIDDTGSKGHLTKGVGTERRVNLIVHVAEEWEVPQA
jgi:hypothetical protein